MSATDHRNYRSTTEKLERDTLVSFTPDRAKHQKYSSDSSIFSPSKLPEICSPPADVNSNRPLNIMPCQQSTPFLVAKAMIKMLEDMGVQYAFGVWEVAIALLWEALKHSFIRVLHFHHKAGAAFAASQAQRASGGLVVVFNTTIPESAIALTGKPAPTQSPMQMFLHWGSLFYYVSTQQVQRATPVRFLSGSPSV